MLSFSLPLSKILEATTSLTQGDIKVGELYLFIPDAKDANGDSLSFSVEQLPAWADFNETSGEISGTPLRTDIGNYPDILIRVSDGSAFGNLAAFTINVNPEPITKEDITADTIIDIPQADLDNESQTGVVASGQVSVDLGDTVYQLENADIRFVFDEDGILVEVSGTASAPIQVSEHFSLAGQVDSQVGLYKGSDINKNPSFDIQLKDEFYYFVYYLSTGVEVTLGGRNGEDPKSLTLELPIGGELLIITDPLDPFYYYFASTPITGTYGYGESEQGLIPFQPTENFSGLDSFDGHKLDKAEMSIGVKFFDFFSIAGTRVIRDPQFKDIDWLAPLESDIEFKAGINGIANFAFSVFGVGLFEFNLASTSATLDVGFDRQQMAMQMTIAPDVSWQPEWFSILPTSEIVGNWLINGDGTISAELKGSYQSTIPETSFKGSMLIENSGVTFTSSIPHDDIPIDLVAEFLDPTTTYLVSTERDISDSVSKEINAAFDRILANKLDAFNQLESAISDFEFEVSLRGVRSTLPTIADRSISVLNALPTSISDEVYDGVRSGINDRRVCTFLGCIPSNSKRDSIARDARDDAQTTTTNRIKPYVASLIELKKRALQADDPTLRQSLEVALRQAYAHRFFKEEIKVKVDLPSPLKDYTHTELVNERVLSKTNADRILLAANNMKYIQTTSDIRVSAQQIFDQIPVDQAVEKARQEVEDGLQQIPTFDGAGMSVTNGSYSAYILLDDKQYDADFNILNPIELLLGITDLSASYVISRE